MGLAEQEWRKHDDRRCGERHDSSMQTWMPPSIELINFSAIYHTRAHIRTVQILPLAHAEKQKHRAKIVALRVVGVNEKNSKLIYVNAKYSVT